MVTQYAYNKAWGSHKSFKISYSAVMGIVLRF